MTDAPITPRDLQRLARAIHSATPCGTKAKAEALRAASRDAHTYACWDVIARLIPTPGRPCDCKKGHP